MHRRLATYATWPRRRRKVARGVNVTLKAFGISAYWVQKYLEKVMFVGRQKSVSGPTNLSQFAKRPFGAVRGIVIGLGLAMIMWALTIPFVWFLVR